MSQAIHPITEYTTRRAKRGYQKEHQKIEPYIEDLECKMELTIFEAPKEISYADIYKHFNAKWKELVQRLMLEFKLKYAMIDIHHFEKQYKPYI
jgi:hypothetical protein